MSYFDPFLGIPEEVDDAIAAMHVDEFTDQFLDEDNYEEWSKKRESRTPRRDV